MEYQIGDVVRVSYLGSEFNVKLISKRLITGLRLRNAQGCYPELGDFEYEYGGDSNGDVRTLTRCDIVKLVKR